jgi:hypothetical protein
MERRDMHVGRGKACVWTLFEPPGVLRTVETSVALGKGKIMEVGKHNGSERIDGMYREGEGRNKEMTALKGLFKR